MSPTLTQTAALINIVHGNQFDKAGERYVGHLERVHGRALVLSADVDDAAIRERISLAALLHGIIEDSAASGVLLSALGYDDPTIRIIETVTRKRDEPYEQFIVRIASRGTEEAIIVKIADLEDNCDPGRLALLSIKDRERLRAKYEPALKLLRGILKDRTLAMAS